MKRRIRRLLSPTYRLGLGVLEDLFYVYRASKIEIRMVDPQAISYTVNRNDPTLLGRPLMHIGTVSDGDWDLNGIAIRDYGDIYKIMEQRMLQNIPLEKIPEWASNASAIERGEKTPEGCKTVDAYRRRWSQNNESTFLRIQREGYRRQSEIHGGRWHNEIRVQIGRTGEYLFEDGIHRLVVTQLLNLKQIPVLITRRHRQSLVIQQGSSSP